MALVSSIEKSRKDRQIVHRPTRCFYSIVEADSGERYVQLDTYGTDERQHPDKVSQSIQFDQQAARQLLIILHEVFPALA